MSFNKHSLVEDGMHSKQVSGEEIKCTVGVRKCFLFVCLDSLRAMTRYRCVLGDKGRVVIVVCHLVLVVSPLVWMPWFVSVCPCMNPNGHQMWGRDLCVVIGWV